MNTSPLSPKIRRVVRTLAVASLTLTAFLYAGPASAQEQQSTGQAAPPSSAPPADQSLPATLTLSAGTLVQVRVNESLSSDRNHPGDRFSASLEKPLIADGWVVARRGQLLTGRVTSAQKAGRVSGVSGLGLELNEITMVDGQILPVRTELIEMSAGTSKGRDATALATTTGFGALIGAVAAGGKGAAIGAGAGGAAGAIGVLTTRGRATEVYPESLLTFRLEVPLAVSTLRGQIAFQPVSQSDYAPEQDAYSRRPARRLAPRPYSPYPPYYYAPYPYPYWGYYTPYPFYFGFTSVYVHGRGHRR